jgi:putative flippase GtrA
MAFEPHVAGNLVPMSVPAPAATNARRLLVEVARFLAVGGLATAMSFVGFNALVHGLFLDAAPLSRLPILAFVLANVAAGWVAYVGMRTWAFQERGVSDPVVGMVRFFTLGALTMIIPVVCLWVSRYVLGLSSPVADNVSANVVGLSVGAATRFWVFRRFVFDQTMTPEPAIGQARA